MEITEKEGFLDDVPICRRAIRDKAFFKRLADAGLQVDYLAAVCKGLAVLQSKVLGELWN